VLLLRSGDITFGMGLYRQPESTRSGKFFAKILVASRFLSRIDPAYLLAVADERHFNVDKGAGGDKEEEEDQSFSVLSFLFIFWEGTARYPASFAPSISIHNCPSSLQEIDLE
jgi:hypothetical protein